MPRPDDTDTAQAPSLIDRFGRRVDYVRLSVTDRCDFRCVYCMTEDMQFLPRQQVLTLEEIYSVGRAFTELGVTKLRLTGGEPLVRNNVMSLIQALGRLPGLQELLLTTNGAQLGKLAAPLRDAGVNRINISIDSLDSERFKRITRVGRLDKVLSGIEAARKVGFDRIRLNAVIMKGYNEDEILALTDYAVNHDIDIAFIEEMPLGQASDHAREDTVCSNDWVRERIESRYTLVNSAATTAGPSKYFQIPGQKSRIGFISPMSHNFCADCNRVRVTVEGRLLLCLGNEHSADLRSVLRQGSDAAIQDELASLERASETPVSDALKQAIIAAMDLKPERHHFYEQDYAQPVRLMNMTGG
ncbi:cyclic pyranopterin phosphate synthase MoaA [Pseudohongiella acticola]|jgi:GTP 3',8-cyclase|uniref:GTP 3',8-cyclase n=1 Tax=Pseudohongiella acticola TaxID=1524254 RepID=A0A1E8CI99_9GAMM|nr:GTP 3',8-cyclase MoaA [Pseudohongiella acticola]OFE12015.1 cyclic pyranopterin phosphate synthase MoaA [Pseudohongiella acticola]